VLEHGHARHAGQADQTRQPQHAQSREAFNRIVAGGRRVHNDARRRDEQHDKVLAPGRRQPQANTSAFTINTMMFSVERK
jgi:hypothetical protein